MGRVRVTMVVAVVVVWFLLVGGCLAVSPDLLYNVYKNNILQSYQKSFIKSRPCDCRMLCFTANNCTAVSFIASPGEVECRLSNNTSPITLLASHDQAATLVKMAFDHAVCEEGEVRQEEGSCQVTHCQNGKLEPYTGSMVPNISFPILLANGCLYLNDTPMTFDDARAVCQTVHGGDLFVAGDFEGLRDYLDATGLKDVWVGARNRTWLNGRLVDINEWERNDPNGEPDECVRMWKFQDLYWMADKNCDLEFPFLCRIGVSY